MRATGTREQRRGILAAVALLALVASACSSDPEPPPPISANIDSYAALGDSYSAGAGISPVADSACYRSEANYGSLAAKELGVADYKDVTCGGATTSDMVRSQDSSGEVINAPQFGAITKETDLVTIGIGLNDSGLSIQLLYVCLPQLNLDANCKQYLALPESAIDDAIDQVVDQVKVVLKQIRKRAPKAQVVLVGYPRMLPDQGKCLDRLALTGKSATRLKHTLHEVNERYLTIAKDEGAHYVDMYTPSAGHDVCSTEPWVNGETDGGASGAPLHPTPAFERAVSERIVALVNDAQKAE